MISITPVATPSPGCHARSEIQAQGEPTIIMTEEMIRNVFQLNSCIVSDPVTATSMCIPISRVVADNAELNSIMDSHSNVSTIPLNSAPTDSDEDDIRQAETPKNYRCCAANNMQLVTFVIG